MWARVESTGRNRKWKGAPPKSFITRPARITVSSRPNSAVKLILRKKKKIKKKKLKKICKKKKKKKIKKKKLKEICKKKKEKKIVKKNFLYEEKNL